MVPGLNMYEAIKTLPLTALVTLVTVDLGDDLGPEMMDTMWDNSRAEEAPTEPPCSH